MKTSKDKILAALITLIAGSQIVLAILFFNEDGNPTIINLGWVVLWISAIFGLLPIFTLKKWGGVHKGQSYMHTTVLVDRGIYSIVRHPQYVAGMLIGLALPLISQNWLVALLGIFLITILYLNTFDEEKSVIDVFGDEYRQYMQRVPRVNFLLGIYRVLRKKSDY